MTSRPLSTVGGENWSHQNFNACEIFILWGIQLGIIAGMNRKQVRRRRTKTVVDALYDVGRPKLLSTDTELRKAAFIVAVYRSKLRPTSARSTPAFAAAARVAEGAVIESTTPQRGRLEVMVSCWAFRHGSDRNSYVLRSYSPMQLMTFWNPTAARYDQFYEYVVGIGHGEM